MGGSHGEIAVVTRLYISPQIDQDCGNFNLLSRPTKSGTARMRVAMLYVLQMSRLHVRSISRETRKKGDLAPEGAADRTGPTRHQPRKGFTPWGGGGPTGDITRVFWAFAINDKLTTHTHAYTHTMNLRGANLSPPRKR